MFDKNYLTKITAGIYRVTDLFPEKEPLKFLIREKANQILSAAVLADFIKKDSLCEEIFRNIAVLDVYFNVAKAQNWVKPENFFVLETEYRAIAQIARETLNNFNSNEKNNKVIEAEKPAQKPVNQDLPDLKPRQEKILQVLKSNGASQVRHISQVLPKYDKRVLRRDLALLIERGLVLKIGSKTKTEYKFNRL